MTKMNCIKLVFEINKMNRNNTLVLYSGGGLLIYTLYNLAYRVTRLEFDVIELKYYKNKK